jgi:hypothetical protein
MLSTLGTIDPAIRKCESQVAAGDRTNSGGRAEGAKPVCIATSRFLKIAARSQSHGRSRIPRGNRSNNREIRTTFASACGRC